MSEWPSCGGTRAHTTAVDDRGLPPVRRGSAGAEHPEGGLLTASLCLNKQAPRPKKKEVVLWGSSCALTWPSCGGTETGGGHQCVVRARERSHCPFHAAAPPAGTQRQEVATSALCERGSGAPRRRAPRGPCLCSNTPGKKKKKSQTTELTTSWHGRSLCK
jgi:hypothetical protein